LEEKVEERTTELKLKNERLLSMIQTLKETRAQLINAEKLAALGELTAGVAHEINNPTAVMLGNLDLLVAELGKDAEPVKEEIDLVIEQIFRIKDIINSLLQYARTDQMSGEAVYTDVNSVIEHTLVLVRHLRSKSDFEINLDLKATRQVKINSQELQQVLVNLVVNAVHALHQQDGEISLRSSDWENKGVVIEVIDNGSGIAPQRLGSIFNPFNSGKPTGEGTGLGLSVSYSLIKKYGGEIGVSSELGKGSVFTIWLYREADMVDDEKSLFEHYNN
ncbi:MAG: ATP-binding protein, partial [Candidatus Thiodiazotropha endolucinida]|nr:ATP-binding protein [Candidatus Thiodiazotropha taylori]MCW4240409.1 ATP-binding protein [Candidatus Thiodiazotropha taylori]